MIDVKFSKTPGAQRNALEKLICYALSLFACFFSLINPVLHAYSQPITGAHTHFQFMIQAQGQNCHGGLVLALTLQSKRLSEFPLTYTKEPPY